MTKDDLIRMAREAGIPSDELYHSNIERFVALVAAAEREACAKVCAELVPDISRTANDASVWDVATFDCAEAIRARKETT